jgi:hypothetical protein
MSVITEDHSESENDLSQEGDREDTKDTGSVQGSQYTQSSSISGVNKQVSETCWMLTTIQVVVSLLLYLKMTSTNPFPSHILSLTKEKNIKNTKVSIMIVN